MELKVYLFRASSLPIIRSFLHSALVSFMKVLMTASKQSQDGTKTLHVSGVFSVHHQEFSTVHLALVSFMKVFDDRFQAASGWNCILS